MICSGCCEATCGSVGAAPCEIPANAALVPIAATATKIIRTRPKPGPAYSARGSPACEDPAVTDETDPTHAISRRRLLGTGAATAAGSLAAALPRAIGAPKHRKTRKVDVAIVGAGFAGLTAAHVLEG